MGYSFIRAAVFKNAAAMSAGIPVAKELAELLAKSYDADVRVIAPAWSGCPSRVGWVIRDDKLNHFYERFAAALADERYTTLVKRLAEHIDGTLSHDEVWREVPSASSATSRAARFVSVRSISFKNLGAMAAALPICKEICDYIFSSQDAPTRLYAPVLTGAVSRVFMIRMSDDLDGAQATMDQVMSDNKFRPMLQRLIEHVDGSKTEDSLWRVV